MKQVVENCKDFVGFERIALKGGGGPGSGSSLTIEEEPVSAFGKTYCCHPIYTQVTNIFNCSWDQIRNIISKRDTVFSFDNTNQAKIYSRSSNSNTYDIDRNRSMNSKRSIYDMLCDCICEYIERTQFYNKALLTEELLQMKAIEFCKAMQINDFIPSKQWCAKFINRYNVYVAETNANKFKIPPSSLDMKDIMDYCAKSKTRRSLSSKLMETKKSCESTEVPTSIIDEDEIDRVRARKLNFLERALEEYMHRALFHHKSIKLNDDHLLKIASDLNQMLKIHDFVPAILWLEDFKSRYKIDLKQQTKSGSPPLSLDLRDILTYCSRANNKDKHNTVTLTPKGETQNVPLYPLAFTMGKSNKSPVRSFEDDLSEVSIVKLPANCTTATISQNDNENNTYNEFTKNKPGRKRSIKKVETNGSVLINFEKEPTLKIRKIESINADSMISNGKISNADERKSLLNNQLFDNITDGLPVLVRNTSDAIRVLDQLEDFATFKGNYHALDLVYQLRKAFKKTGSTATITSSQL